MLHDLYVVAFCVATGFTASGVIANIYKLLLPDADSGIARKAYIGVMVFAGPSVLFGSSLRALREQRSSPFTFWLAAGVSTYWSLVIGMIVLRIAFVL